MKVQSVQQQTTAVLLALALHYGARLTWRLSLLALQAGGYLLFLVAAFFTAAIFDIRLSLPASEKKQLESKSKAEKAKTKSEDEVSDDFVFGGFMKDDADFVFLTKDEPNFRAKIALLKKRGYKWNPADKCWVKP